MPCLCFYSWIIGAELCRMFTALSTPPSLSITYEGSGAMLNTMELVNPSVEYQSFKKIDPY